MIKQFFKSRLPGPYSVAQRFWSARQRRAFERKLARVTRRFVDAHGLRVTGGPFSGMKYVEDATSSALLPKLAGSYEAELQPIVEHAIAAGYKTIVDVGCAEGYYAVGCAYRIPQAHVYAFDSDPAARQLCLRMAELNNVGDRLTIMGQCDSSALAALPLEGALIVCDCEGYEYELLDPQHVPKLLQADLIVELHDFVNPAITPALKDRFQNSHRMEFLANLDRDPSAYPAVSCLPEAYRVLAVDEIRPHRGGFVHLARKNFARTMP